MKHVENTGEDGVSRTRGKLAEAVKWELRSDQGASGAGEL